MPASSSREMGFWMAVALVMGNMIGSGVFLLPASLAPFGGASLVGWLLSAAGSVLLALVFARLSRAYPAAGGPYAYTRQAFGDVPAFMVAWGYWISVSVRALRSTQFRLAYNGLAGDAVPLTVTPRVTLRADGRTLRVLVSPRLPLQVQRLTQNAWRPVRVRPARSSAY